MVKIEDIDLMRNYFINSMGGDNFEKDHVDAALVEPLVFTPFIYEIK
jgi:hypothetical protein